MFKITSFAEFFMFRSLRKFSFSSFLKLDERLLRETRLLVDIFVWWLLGGEDGILLWIECSAFNTLGI